MAIVVPNPYETNIKVNDTTAINGLVEAPKTKYGMAGLIKSASDNFAQKMDKWQSEIDTTNAQAAINETKLALQDLQENPETGWQAAVGANALSRPSGRSLTDEYLEKADKLANERISKLGPGARKLFNAYWATERQALASRLQSHVVKQQVAFGKEQDKITLEIAENDIRSGDMDRINSGFAVQRAMLQKIADRTGTAISVHDTLGALHKDVIGNMVDSGDVAGASAWLKANSGEMSSKQIASAKELISKQKTKNEAQATAATLYEKHKDKPHDLMLAIKAIKDEQKRDLVADYISKQQRLDDAVKRADIAQTMSEIVKIADADQQVPESLWEHLKDLSPDHYMKLRGVDMKGYPTKSDEATYSMLTDMAANDPDGFAETDLNEYAKALSQSDRRYFERKKALMGQAAYKDFVAEVKRRAALDKAFAKSAARNELMAVADAAYVEYANQAKGKYLDKRTRDELVEQVFYRSPGFFGMGRTWAYKEAAKAIKEQGSASGALATANAESGGIGRPAGYDKDLWNRAIQIANKKAAERRAKGDNVVVDLKAVQTVYDILLKGK